MALPLSSSLLLIAAVAAVAAAAVVVVSAGSDGGAAAAAAAPERVNPFTARAALVRYWNRKVPNNRPHPSFFLSKLSLLSALDSATFSSPLLLLQSQPSLPLPLPRLLWRRLPLRPWGRRLRRLRRLQLHQLQHRRGGGARHGLRQLLRRAQHPRRLVPPLQPRLGRAQRLLCARRHVITTNFTSYSGAATAGASSFAAYAGETNVPELRFDNYDAESNSRSKSFSAKANADDESFSGYGKNGNGVALSFASYGNDTNVLGSAFANYGETGNGATNGFGTCNVPENAVNSLPLLKAVNYLPYLYASFYK